MESRLDSEWSEQEPYGSQIISNNPGRLLEIHNQGTISHDISDGILRLGYKELIQKGNSDASSKVKCTSRVLSI